MTDGTLTLHSTMGMARTNNLDLQEKGGGPPMKYQKEYGELYRRQSQKKTRPIELAWIGENHSVSRFMNGRLFSV